MFQTKTYWCSYRDASSYHRESSWSSNPSEPPGVFYFRPTKLTPVAGPSPSARWYSQLVVKYENQSHLTSTLCLSLVDVTESDVVSPSVHQQPYRKRWIFFRVDAIFSRRRHSEDVLKTSTWFLPGSSPCHLHLIGRVFDSGLVLSRLWVLSQNR